MCKACHKNVCPVHIWTTCLSIDELLSRSLLRSYQRHLIFLHFITSPRYIGDGVFLCLYVSFFLCFFVSNITRKRLDRFAWNFQGRYGLWSDHGTTWLHFGQFRETAQCRDAQHGGGVCCALAPQLVSVRNSWLFVVWHHVMPKNNSIRKFNRIDLYLYYL